MKRLFVMIQGPEEGREFVIEEGQKITFGRGQASDTQINDPAISRVHCEVSCDAGRVRIVDRGSSSGTYVNGERVTDRVLKSGETVQLGNCLLRYQVDGPVEASTIVGARPQITPLPKLVGQSLAHYRLDEIITKGHAGMVFKATDTENDRVVAVKVLSPEYAGSDEQKQRFVRAMKTVMPIKHENIVELYNAGKQGPYCWAAMEYVEGDSLAHVIDEIGVAGMLPWQDAYRVAVHMSRALAAAEEHKMVHRNVTPQNILRRASDKVTKLGDLMLAKALEGALSKTVTQPGQLVGDIAYMSPERTQEKDIDHRSDIYELGATLYALLTGRPPFESNSFPELLEMARTATPVRPKKYHLSIPDQFQDVVMQMLAKRPEERYKSATDLQQELHRLGMLNGIDPAKV